MSNRAQVTRISRKAFYKLGGMANPALFRRMSRGQWAYFHDHSKMTSHTDLDIDLAHEADMAAHRKTQLRADIDDDELEAVIAQADYDAYVEDIVNEHEGL